MARFLSAEWVAAFNEAVAGVELPEPDPDADLATRGGAYAWSQVVTGGPAGDVEVTLRVAGRRLSMALRADPDAEVTVRIPWADALAMARGELTPAEAIATGRVRVRGDLAVLRAGQALLAALGPELAALQAATTY
ncbi:MAG TPA: SCP2 sterol-binding domain-containing protein [Acidimicrobiales bacterium]|nr:SCP2 sterol-binding domain-containing protein [Acidimicrobiales bacterium]